MQEAFDRLMQTEHKPDILAPLEMHGRHRPRRLGRPDPRPHQDRAGQAMGLGRAYTELVKEVMDEKGIEYPVPHTTLYLGRDKEGKTDEFPVKLEQVGAASGKAPDKSGE